MDYEYLYSLLSALPPDFTEIEKELKTNNYSSKEVTLVACRFCKDCFDEYTDFVDENFREPLDCEIHSSYVYDVCKLLIKYGLDPNLVMHNDGEETNIMFEIYWITKPYVAADTLRLLLENGGNPYLEFENVPFIYTVDHDFWYDVAEKYYDEAFYTVKFDCRFHFWLVMRGADAANEQEKNYLNHHMYTYEVAGGNGKAKEVIIKKLKA